MASGAVAGTDLDAPVTVLTGDHVEREIASDHRAVFAVVGDVERDVGPECEGRAERGGAAGEFVARRAELRAVRGAVASRWFAI